MFTRCVRAPAVAPAWRTHAIAAALTLAVSATTALAAPPPIRTSAANVVPQCVTPQRLMAFLKKRNPAIAPQFSNIAALYKRHGQAWHVRWDYAFFQMAVETNFLSFKRGDGSWGDAKPAQNNFAGLGTTGGGVPGDSFPNVNTGVLAQIQHLVVYSGEHVKNPVGARTKLKQDDILETMARFKGRTTFSDLSRRWAADRHYGAAIEWVAGNYRATYCTHTAGPDVPAPMAKPVAAKRMQRAAATAAEFEPVAALGGPKDGEASTPPVRTIWSRPKTTDAAAETPAMGPASRIVPAAPAPAALEHADKTPDATGATAPADTAVKEPNKPLVVPTPVEVKPPPRFTPPRPVLQTAADAPKSFAFAASMVAAATAAPAGNEPRCRVFSASYGGTETLLVRATAGAEQQYTALTVLEGFEESMLSGYVKAHAPGGTSLGTFDTRDAALAKASELCPDARNEGASAG